MKTTFKYIGVLLLGLILLSSIKFALGGEAYADIGNRIIHGSFVYLIVIFFLLRSRKSKGLSLEFGVIFQNVLLLVVCGYAFSLLIDHVLVVYFDHSLAEKIEGSCFNAVMYINEMFGMSPVEKAQNLANVEFSDASKYTIRRLGILYLISLIVCSIPFALLLTYFSRKLMRFTTRSNNQLSKS